MSEAALELLGPLATERVRDLVKRRLLYGLKFFRGESGHNLRPEFSRPDVKLALLLVRIANPKECFSAAEAKLLESRQKHFSAETGQISAETGQKRAGSKKRKKLSL